MRACSREELLPSASLQRKLGRSCYHRKGSYHWLPFVGSGASVSRFRNASMSLERLECREHRKNISVTGSESSGHIMTTSNRLGLPPLIFLSPARLSAAGLLHSCG